MQKIHEKTKKIFFEKKKFNNAGRKKKNSGEYGAHNKFSNDNIMRKLKNKVIESARKLISNKINNNINKQKEVNNINKDNFFNKNQIKNTDIKNAKKDNILDNQPIKNKEEINIKKDNIIKDHLFKNNIDNSNKKDKFIDNDSIKNNKEIHALVLKVKSTKNTQHNLNSVKEKKS